MFFLSFFFISLISRSQVGDPRQANGVGPRDEEEPEGPGREEAGHPLRGPQRGQAGDRPREPQDQQEERRVHQRGERQ